MDTSKSITLSQAFSHCASTSSYWLWIFIAIAASIGTIILLTKINNKQQVNPMVKTFIYFAIAAAILCSIFIRPTSVHENTSVDAAARNHYLGY